MKDGDDYSAFPPSTHTQVGQNKLVVTEVRSRSYQEQNKHQQNKHQGNKIKEFTTLEEYAALASKLRSEFKRSKRKIEPEAKRELKAIADVLNQRDNAFFGTATKQDIETLSATQEQSRHRS